MGKDKVASETETTPRAMSPAILVVLTALDTTWRMFIPILGLLALGLWLDKQLNMSPWLMLAGLVLGIVAAAGLVFLQYRRVR